MKKDIIIIVLVSLLLIVVIGGQKTKNIIELRAIEAADWQKGCAVSIISLGDGELFVDGIDVKVKPEEPGYIKTGLCIWANPTKKTMISSCSVSGVNVGVKVKTIEGKGEE